MPVIIGAKEYPENIIEKLKNKDIDVVSVDAEELAYKAGNVKTVNVALIGLMSKSTDIPEEVWLDAIKSTVPPKVLDVNIEAFKLGRSA